MATILQPDKKQLEKVAQILQNCQEKIEKMDQDLFNPTFQKSIYKANDTYFLVGQEVSQQLEQLKFPQYAKIINTIVQGQMHILQICLSQTYVTQEKVDKISKDRVSLETNKIQKRFDKQQLNIQQELSKQKDEVNKLAIKNQDLQTIQKQLEQKLKDIEAQKNEIQKELDNPKTPPQQKPPAEEVIEDTNLDDSDNKVQFIMKQKEKIQDLKQVLEKQMTDLDVGVQNNDEKIIKENALKIDQTINQMEQIRFKKELDAGEQQQPKIQSDQNVEKYQNMVQQLRDQVQKLQNQLKLDVQSKNQQQQHSQQAQQPKQEQKYEEKETYELTPHPKLEKMIKQQEDELLKNQQKDKKTKFVPKIKQTVPARKKSLDITEMNQSENTKPLRADSAKKPQMEGFAGILAAQMKKNVGEGDIISQHEIGDSKKEVGIQTEKDRMAREYIEIQSQLKVMNKKISKLTSDLEISEKKNSKLEHDVHVKSNQVDQIKADNIKQMKLLQEKIKEKNQQRETIVEKSRKVETDNKATDTTQDRKDITNLQNITAKKEEAEAITQELDAGIADLDNFLKNRKNINFKDEQKSAENDLKNVLKDLGKNKARAIDLEKEGNKLLSREDHTLNVDFQRKNKIDQLNERISQLQNELRTIKEKQLFGMKSVEIQTLGGRDMERNEALAKEYLARREKMTQREKQMQDMENELFSVKQVLRTKIDEIGTKNNKIYSMQKEIETLKKTLKQMAATPDKDKISDIDRKIMHKMITENLELKIKLQGLISDIKDIDKENKKMIGRFRIFIQNMPNLTDEQKRALLGKLEDLNLDLTEKFNMRDLEKMAKIDESTLKSSIVKNVVGNSMDLIKQIKKKERQNQVKRNQINYNPDFDPDLLDENEEIQVRKVKKKVKRIDENGNEYEVEIEVEEQVVVDKKTGKVLRARDMPQQGVQMSQETAAFLDKFGGMAIGGAKINNMNKPKGPRGKQYNNVQDIIANAKDKKTYKDAQGREVNEYTVKDKIIDENGNEIEVEKKIKVFKDAKGREVIEEEFVNEKGEKVKVQRTKYKNAQGQEVIEERFINDKGEEVIVQKIISKDKYGNEIIEEIQIDKFGNKTVKRTKATKNAKGEEVIEEEYINEKGEKVKVQRIKKKDKDGNEYFEEITIGKDGKIQKKNIKMTKNEKGETVMEEEFVNEKGEKVKVQKIVRKDSKGNEYVEEVTIDSKGRKVVKNIRKFVNDKGEEVVEEEIINEKGEKIKVQRIVKKDKDGNEIIEEVTIDANGNKTVTQKKRVFENGVEKVVTTKINADGTQEVVTEVMGRDGKKQVITEKYAKDGKLVSKNEKTVKVDRNKITGEEKHFDDNSDLEYEERVTMVVDPKTGKLVKKIEKVNKYNKHTNKVVTKHKDADGNEVINEKYVDEFGNVQEIEKKVFTNAKGEKVERIVDKKTGKVVERIVKVGKDGKEYVEETITDANGNKIKRVVKKTKDIYGNDVEEIEETDQFGNVTIKKNIISVDEHGNKKVISQVVDPNNPNNNKTIQKQYVEKDNDGNEVQVEEYIDANGKKCVQRTKKVKDKNGNEVEIIETVDEHGNVKQQIKTYDKNGNVVMKEVIKDKNGNIIEQKQVETDRNGQVKEIVMDKDGQVISETINKLGSDSKQTQTSEIYELIMGDLEQNLKRLPGMDDKKAQLILNAIHQFVKNGMPFYLDNDENRCEEIYRLAQKNIDKHKKNVKKQEGEDARIKRMQELQDERDAKKRALEEKLSKKNQKDIRYESEEDKLHRLYRFLMENKNSTEMLKQLRELLGLPQDQHIDFETFCKYMEMFKSQHQKCGESGICVHLRRFFDKIGFNPGFNNREFLKMKDGKVHDFNKEQDAQNKNQPVNNRKDAKL